MARRLPLAVVVVLCGLQLGPVASASAPVGGLTPLGCVGNSGTGPPSCIGVEGLDGADSVAVSPDGKNVYVASGNSDAVVLFERVAGGGLKPMGCVGNSGSGPPGCIGVEGLRGADSVAVSPDGKNVYVASSISKAVVLFERVAGGGLKPMGCVGNSGTGPPGCIGADGLDGADSVAVSPDGKNVYVASRESDAVVLFERVAGGGLKPMGCVGNSGTGPPSCIGADGLDGARSVAVSPDGKNVYVSSDNSDAVVLFERVAGGGLKPMGCVGNSGSGPPSCIGADGLDEPISVAVSPDGSNVYVASFNSDAVVLFERVAGGGLKPMGCVGNSGTGPPSCIGADGLDGAASVAVSPDGSNVYVASFNGSAVALFERFAGGGLKPMGCVGNSGTGPPSCIGADGLDAARSVAVSPDGQNVYVASNDSNAVVLFSRVTASQSGAGGGGGGGATGNTNGGGATGNTNGAGTSVTTTVGNLGLTLSIAGSSACLARPGPLQATLSSSTVPHSTGPSLHFIRASVFVDRGVRHVHRRSVLRNHRRVTVTTVTYSANRTVTSLPASISLKLAGLASGTHMLRVSYLFHKTVRRHGKRVTIPVTKTQSAKFHVC